MSEQDNSFADHLDDVYCSMTEDEYRAMVARNRQSVAFEDMSIAERRVCFPSDGDDEANGVQLRSAWNTR